MKRLLLLLSFLLLATNCYAATRYWVGGGSSANWNATGNTNWGTASNTQDNASVPGSADDVIFDGVGTGASNSTLSADITINSLNFTGYANALTHNASIILTIDGQDGSGNTLIMGAGMTYTHTPATSRITFTGVGTSKITTNGIVLGKVQFNNSGDTFQLQDNLTLDGTNTGTGATFLRTTGTFDPQTYTVTLTGTGGNVTIEGSSAVATTTFYNLVRTGGATKTDNLILVYPVAVTNTMTLTGNSGINRLLVLSPTLGSTTSLTVTGATISGCSNVDFRDIAFVSTGAVDFSAITGGSGDCGGNSISGGGALTFTTADDWYWNGSGTRNFSDYTYWYDATNGGGSQMASTRCPLPQDTCYINSDSIDGTTHIDQDLPRIPAIDCTGANTFTFDCNNVNQQLYGNFILSNNVAFTSGSGSALLDFYGLRGSHNLNPSGKQFGYVAFYAYGGTYALLGNLDTNSWYNRDLNFYNGTFDAATYNVTTNSLGGEGTATREVKMGSGTWSVDSYILWRTATGFTLTAGTSTLNYSGSSNVWLHNGCNFYDVNFQSNCTCRPGVSTWHNVTITAGKNVSFESTGTTLTVNDFTLIGNSLNRITLRAETAGTPFYLVKSGGGTITVSYTDITDSNASPTTTWYYDANSTADAYSQANGWAASATTSGYIGHSIGVGIGRGTL